MNEPWIDGLSSVDEVIDNLVRNASEQTKKDASHDALLVFDFFPRLGPGFQTSPDFTKEQVQQFKDEFNYERYGLERETALKRIEKYRSIDQILDALVEMIPVEVREQLMRRYLLEIWFKQNSKGDLEHFRDSLKRDYWLK